MFGVVSHGISRIPALDVFLGAPWKMVHPFLPLPTGVETIVGWGKKPTADKARRIAKKYNLPYLSLEDGFLRSLGLGVSGSAPLSLVVDDIGIYYDSTRPSRLENLIQSGAADPRAEEAMKLIVENRLSKYNHAPDAGPLKGTKPKVLVVDQTFADMSVVLGGADSETFSRMLKSAKEENPAAEIIVKIHPDVLAGKKKGNFSGDEEGVTFFSEDVSPLSLLESVEKVYVVTSHMGFEALLAGKPVITFGLPWYAGWGLTDDRHPLKLFRRSIRPTLPEIFTAAYMNYPVYVDPVRKKRTDIFSIITYLKLNKELSRETGHTTCIGMSPWKKTIVRPFLSGSSSRPDFVRTVSEVSSGKQPVTWGFQNEAPGIWRMEDGFLRSVGLGSDLHRPLSLVLDKRGMYYDPSKPSDLEVILSSVDLPERSRERVSKFRSDYVALKMSKYNLSSNPLQVNSQGKKILLVPGQVEDDESIKRGTRGIVHNQGLLEEVRKLNPDAFIIYKPHPDVVAGNRKGQLTDSSFADVVVEHAHIISCIEASDEIHTLTSLTGLEGLLHNKIVHCYGIPFYSGWGLTIDLETIDRRSRKLSLDELIYGTFFIYPRYIVPGVEGLVLAEDVLWYLSLALQKSQSGDLKSSGWWSRKKRKLKALVETYRNELKR